MAKNIHLSWLARRSAVSFAVGLMAASAEAAPLTLQDLLNGQSLVVGNVEFLNFRNFSSTGAGGAAPVDPKAVIVTPVDELFHLGLATEGATFGADPGQSKRWSFDFDGAVIADGLPVDAASAAILDAAFGGPGGVVFSRVIVEPFGLPAEELFVQRTYDDRLRESVGVKLGKVLVSTFKTTGGSDVPTESLGFNFAKMSYSYGLAAPEPETLMLMGAGLVGLLGKLRRPR